MVHVCPAMTSLLVPHALRDETVACDYLIGQIKKVPVFPVGNIRIEDFLACAKGGHNIDLTDAIQKSEDLSEIFYQRIYIHV